MKNGKRWAIGSAAALTVTALTVIGGATAANADTTSDSPLMSLGHYAIPDTEPAPSNGPSNGLTLPTVPGQIGQPVTIRMTGIGDASQALANPNASTSWGNPTRTEEYYNYDLTSDVAGQTWVFQDVGYVDVRDAATAHADAAEGTQGQLQRLPVYKIIQYHSDGTHTCLDGFGGDPLAGAAVDSYGCDVNGFNQPNQLWVFGYPGANAPMTDAHGNLTGESQPEWLSNTIQESPYTDDIREVLNERDAVMENLASLQAYSWSTANPAVDTRLAPVVSASTPTDPSGNGEPATLQMQNGANVNDDNSTWMVAGEDGDED